MTKDSGGAMGTGVRVLVATLVAGSGVGASAVEKTPGLEEVVVTAQRRAQNLQDVPVAVTAIPDVKSRNRLPSTSSNVQPEPRAATNG